MQSRLQDGLLSTQTTKKLTSEVFLTHHRRSGLTIIPAAAGWFLIVEEMSLKDLISEVIDYVYL